MKPAQQKTSLVQRKAEIKTDLTEQDFDTKSKILKKVGAELMDLDYLAKSLYSNVPSTSTELRYRMQLSVNMKIYLLFTAIGFLMVVAVILFL